MPHTGKSFIATQGIISSTFEGQYEKTRSLLQTEFDECKDQRLTALSELLQEKDKATVVARQCDELWCISIC
jgi:hypothetical protein